MFSLRMLAAAALCAAGSAAWADSASGTGLRLNGFGTLGVAQTFPGTDWAYQRELSQPSPGNPRGLRADLDSRLGLQANWAMSRQWEAVAQVVLKPMAHEADTQESLAWAFVAFHPTPEWTLRAGRTSPDLFLLADYRNVGFAYPWMRPSVEFYGWMPVFALDGADVARQWTTGGGVQWQAKLFSGRSRATWASRHDDGDTKVIIDSLTGATLRAELQGVTVKATLARARSRPVNEGPVAQLWQLLDQVAQVPVPSLAGEAVALRDSFPLGAWVTNYGALGLAWDGNDWQWQAEIAKVTGNFASSNSSHAYVSGTYRSGKLSWFGMVGRVKPDHEPLPVPNWAPTLAPLVGPVNAAIAQGGGMTASTSYNLGRNDQGSVSVGVRWDLTPQMALKLQLDDVAVHAYGGGLWSYDTADPLHVRVVSGGLDFVF
jgi:hypothetical protein